MSSGGNRMIPGPSFPYHRELFGIPTDSLRIPSPSGGVDTFCILFSDVRAPSWTVVCTALLTPLTPLVSSTRPLPHPHPPAQDT